MAKLKVDTDAVRAAAHRFRVGAAQLAIAAQCHRDASRWDCDEQTLLAAFETHHEAVADMLQRQLDKASTVLANSAHALAEAARRYDTGDAKAARLLDSEAR